MSEIKPLLKPRMGDQKKAPADTSGFPLPKPHFHRDSKYRAWVRQHPCALRAVDCKGPIEAAHLAKGGKAIKGDDSSCVPLCKLKHHSSLDEYRLDGWNEAVLWRKAWELREIWNRRESNR